MIIEKRGTNLVKKHAEKPWAGIALAVLLVVFLVGSHTQAPDEQMVNLESEKLVNLNLDFVSQAESVDDVDTTGPIEMRNGDTRTLAISGTFEESGETLASSQVGDVDTVDITVDPNDIGTMAGHVFTAGAPGNVALTGTINASKWGVSAVVDIKVYPTWCGDGTPQATNSEGGNEECDGEVDANCTAISGGGWTDGFWSCYPEGDANECTRDEGACINCTSTCDPEGYIGCTGGDEWTCEDGGDGCYYWSATTDCGPSTTCTSRGCTEGSGCYETYNDGTECGSYLICGATCSSGSCSGGNTATNCIKSSSGCYARKCTDSGGCGATHYAYNIGGNCYTGTCNPTCSPCHVSNCCGTISKYRTDKTCVSVDNCGNPTSTYCGSVDCGSCAI